MDWYTYLCVHSHFSRLPLWAHVANLTSTISPFLRLYIRVLVVKGANCLVSFL